MDLKKLNKHDKRKALWLGSIVGDAFVLGGRLIYDLAKLQSSFPDYNRPQAPLASSFHKNKTVGDQTHYGDQARQLWQYLADNDGHYDPACYRREWTQFIAHYDGYMDKASTETLVALKNDLQFGSDSNELGGSARLAAIYYWIEDPKQALAAAIDQSRMTHNNRRVTAITYLIAQTLEIILTEPDNQAQPSVLAVLDRVRMQMAVDHTYDLTLINDSFAAANAQTDLSAASIAKKIGQSCHAQHAFPAILAILKQSEDYQQAMKLNVRIGGDSAARALIIGALLGAKLGSKAIPQEWIEVVRN